MAVKDTFCTICNKEGPNKGKHAVVDGFFFEWKNPKDVIPDRRYESNYCHLIDDHCFEADRLCLAEILKHYP